LSARNTAGIKVRQPLAKAMVFNEKEIHELSDELAEIVTDELNVNGLEFVKNVNQLVSYRVLPNNRLLGPKFGSQFPDVRAALDALDGAVVNDKVSAGEVVTIVLDGEDVILTAEEVLVEVQPAEDLAVATDKGITVAIDTVLTDELRMMGLAREFVRRVQDVRKQADFNISDRISVLYQASPNLKAAVEAQSEYIQNEVLAVELGEGDVTSAEYFTEEALAFEDEEVRIGVTRKNKS